MAAKKTSTKKAAAKKTPAKKTAAKKAPARKAPAKKAAPKKTAAKKAPVKKAPAKKPAARKAPAKKPAAKTAPARKGAKRATTAKAAPKKASAPRKAAPKKAKTLAQKIADVAVSVVEGVTGGGRTEPAPTETASSEAPPAEARASEAAPAGAENAPAAAAPAPASAPEQFPGPQVGDEAPDFTLPADDGSTVSLHDLRGKKVVLYFYPRDNTPGCTLEARDFSQLLPEFEAKNAIVLGVSTDDVGSHQHFKKTCELSVKLLADADKTAHNAFGTWREKNMYGKTVWGTARTTYLIDENGHIARVWPKVKVEDHALDVLNAL